MNNEDKAKDIAKLKNPKLAEFPNLSAVHEYGLECAMEMAEWKDKQAKAVLDDLRKEFAGEGYGSARWLLSEVEKRLGL